MCSAHPLSSTDLKISRVVINSQCTLTLVQVRPGSHIVYPSRVFTKARGIRVFCLH